MHDPAVRAGDRFAPRRGVPEAAADRAAPRNLYLYAVCLITLVVSVFAAVQLVRGTVEIFYPEADSASFGWTAYTPLETEFGGAQFLSEEQLTDVHRRPGILDVVSAGTTLLLAGGVYAYHWRRVQSKQPHLDADAPAS